MKIVLLTPENTHPDEHENIKMLFSHGLELLHVRKPSYSCDEMRAYLKNFNSDEHAKMSLHSFPELLNEFDLGGFHKTSNHPNMPATKISTRVSASYHTFEEVLKARELDYCFLSPIFESTSKPGYGPHFSATELVQVLSEAQVPVFALGGVTVDKIPQLKKMPFSGIAVLGAVWMQPDPVRAFVSLKEALKNSLLSGLSGEFGDSRSPIIAVCTTKTTKGFKIGGFIRASLKR